MPKAPRELGELFCYPTVCCRSWRWTSFASRSTGWSLVSARTEAKRARCFSCFRSHVVAPLALSSRISGCTGTAEEPPEWQEPRLSLMSLNKESSLPSSPPFRRTQHHRGASCSSSSAPGYSDSSRSSSCTLSVKKERDPEPQFDVRRMESGLADVGSEAQSGTKEEERYAVEADEDERRGWRDANQFGRRWIEACAGIVLRCVPGSC